MARRTAVETFVGGELGAVPSVAQLVTRAETLATRPHDETLLNYGNVINLAVAVSTWHGCIRGETSAILLPYSGGKCLSDCPQQATRIRPGGL